MAEDRRLREPANEKELAEAEEQIEEAKRAAREDEEAAEAVRGVDVVPTYDPPWRDSGASPT